MKFYAIFTQLFLTHSESFMYNYLIPKDDPNDSKVYFTPVAGVMDSLWNNHSRCIVEVTITDSSMIHRFKHQNMACWVHPEHATYWTNSSNVTYGESYDMYDIETHKMLMNHGYDYYINNGFTASINKLGHQFDLFLNKELYEFGCNSWNYGYRARGYCAFMEYLVKVSELDFIKLIVQLIRYSQASVLMEAIYEVSIVKYIQLAYEQSNVDMLEYWLGFKCDLNKCLNLICQDGQIEIVQELLKRGVISTNETLQIATKNDHFETAKLLIEHNSIDFDLNDVLIQAIKKHNLSMVKFVVERGADVLFDDSLPLRLA